MENRTISDLIGAVFFILSEKLKICLILQHIGTIFTTKRQLYKIKVFWYPFCNILNGQRFRKNRGCKQTLCIT